MQIKDFTNLLKRPETISAGEVDFLSSEIKKYPYLQSLRALHLKGLKLSGSKSYNSALKITAAYTTDRSVLFDYITSKIFNQNQISEQIKQNSETIKTIEINQPDDISVNKSVVIDDTLKAQIKATEGVLDPNLYVAKEDVMENTEAIEEPEINLEDSITEIELPKEENIDLSKSPETILNIGKPLEFEKTEHHSFAEWLKITSFKPILRKEEAEETAPPLEGKLAIIDKFLEENPKIKPVSDKPPKPQIVVNSDSSDTMMTGNLARIFHWQKN